MTLMTLSGGYSWRKMSEKPLTPVIVTAPFQRKLAKKPKAMQQAILECVRRLRVDPHHPGLRTHRVQGRRGVFEARIDGGNRLTFAWSGDTIVLRTHCNHDILKNP
jgi:hypothetical protein